MIRTFQYRIMDSCAGKRLAAHARAVNFVWNFCNDRQKDALRWNRKWLSGFDLSNLCAGASKELGLHSQTVQAICERYAQSRSEKKRPYLRYRGKKHLGWIPFKASGIKLADGVFTYAGRAYRTWYSRTLSGKVKTGSFSCDSQGRWFINITCDVPEANMRPAARELGIDLGLKDLAAFSDETLPNVEAQRFYRDLEPALATAQRTRKKRQVTAMHQKIARRRKDHLHKLSSALLKVYGFISIGKISSAQLAQTRLSKSVLDAGWSMFTRMLGYKAIAHRAMVVEVDERFTTQDCSACGARSGPKGLKELGIREWACCACGAIHDRDRNAAMNILRRGRATLAGGIPVLTAQAAAAG